MPTIENPPSLHDCRIHHAVCPRCGTAITRVESTSFGVSEQLSEQAYRMRGPLVGFGGVTTILHVTFCAYCSKCGANTSMDVSWPKRSDEPDTPDHI
jgi:ribosomal protein L44E